MLWFLEEVFQIQIFSRNSMLVSHNIMRDNPQTPIPRSQSLPSACSLTSQTSVKQGRSTAFDWSSGTNFAARFHFSASSPFEVLSITNDHRPHEGCRVTHIDRHPLRHRLEHIHTSDIDTQTHTDRQTHSDTNRHKNTHRHTYTEIHTHTDY